MWAHVNVRVCNLMMDTHALIKKELYRTPSLADSHASAEPTLYAFSLSVCQPW